MSVAVMLPTYNEAENIESLIREIQALNLDLNVVVIDDSSPDGTADVVRELQSKSWNKIHLVSRSNKLGLGTAITDGFRYLLSLRKPPRYIIAMDADYSHSPKDIPRLVRAARRGNDVVIGSRYLDEGRVVGSSLKRRLISRLANVIASLTICARLCDCTSGFRCYSIDYVKNALPNLHSQTYEIQIETLKQARINKFRVKEIPITFVDRKKGKSKLSSSEVNGFLTYIIKAQVGNVLSLLKSRKS